MDRNNWDDQQGGGYGGRSQQYSSRNYNNYNNRSSGGRGGGGQRDGGYRGSRNNDSYSSRPSNNSFENSNKELMFVETGKVGRIIGRGGSKIRELQEESGARINVNNNNVDGGNTGIDLIGSEDCIEKAKSLIYELLNNDRYSK